MVIYHFRPLSVTESACDITWLVNEDAREGKDYDLDDLTWPWDITTIADKRIIENNQKGINSTIITGRDLIPGWRVSRTVSSTGTCSP